MRQTNVKQGAIRVIAGSALTGKEGYLVKLVDNGGVPSAYLPAALTDVAAYVVVEGAAAGSYCSIEPLEPGRRVRVVANSTTFVAGDKVVARIRREPNETIMKIVAGWPRNFEAKRGRELGFKAESSFEDIIRVHIEDELGGKIA